MEMVRTPRPRGARLHAVYRNRPRKAACSLARVPPGRMGVEYGLTPPPGQQCGDHGVSLRPGDGRGRWGPLLVWRRMMVRRSFVALAVLAAGVTVGALRAGAQEN